MTTVEDRLRQAAASLEAPEHAIPPFRRVRRRVRRRLLIAFGAVLVSLIAVVSVVAAARQVSDRVLVANPGSTLADRTPTTTKAKISATNNGGSTHHGYPHDLVGDAPPIAVDHLGKYTWTSPVVLPSPPDTFSWSYSIGGAGTAQIGNLRATLVKVSGGLSLRATFTVVSFTGSPKLQMIANASGPIPSVAPPGYVFIPDVMGMTQTQATSVLNRVHLGVVVAIASNAQPQTVVAESPTPGSAIRINGVVTITLGSARSGGP